ncbi:sugar ABC transporter ATP-binding protein [Leucobacter sp. USHLN153]|uniref:sugar ABC transporter ATP-binding protein n=1 Tax=Leucobacter sp. USHLN153 TaxID=3081268 RepID=UPI003018A8AE
MNSVATSGNGGRAQSAPAGAARLSVTGLKKAFAGVPALKGVELVIQPGEIHGLLGANGCGKSTLIKILAGFYQADEGEIVVNGENHPVPLGPRGLRDSGVAFVHQDLGLVPGSTVLEHMALDAYGAGAALKSVAWREERARVQELLARFEVHIDPDVMVEVLSPVQRAMVAVVRAVGAQERVSGTRGSLLILDEPTVFLPREEVELLFSLLRRLKSQGDSVLLVSHDLDEVLAVTDRVTVFRDGDLVGSRNTPECTRQDIVEMILGAKDEHVPHPPVRAKDDQTVLLSAEGLTGQRITDLSLELRAGEVVGITGLAGSGFEELPELLYGAHARKAGVIVVDGRQIHKPTPLEMMANRVVLIPSDRKADGAAQELTVVENTALPFFTKYTKGWWIDWADLRKKAVAISEQFNVVPRNTTLPFSSLSGGNQQKALLGKWFDTKPRVMLLNEPTQGVDIGARREIFKLLRAAVADGMTVLCATSDYEQLVELADRVIVLENGRASNELHGADITKDSLAGAVYSQGTQ